MCRVRHHVFCTAFFFVHARTGSSCLWAAARCLSVDRPPGAGTDADFDAPNVDYPKNDSIDYKFFGGKTGGTEMEVYASKLKYMRPVYAMGSGPESEKKSFLRFINFDLPTTTESARLKNFNSLSSAAESGLGDLVNARVLDGYRLMMFHFSDVMDDDVAYYNTVASDEDLLSVGQVVDGGSPAAFAEIILAGSNNLGEERTCYSVVVEVVDQTQVTYDNFVNHIVSVYNEFTEFYDDAPDQEEDFGAFYTNYRQNQAQNRARGKGRYQYQYKSQGQGPSFNWRKPDFNSKELQPNKEGRNPIGRSGMPTHCAICQSINHWAKQCPDKQQDEHSTLLVENQIVLHQILYSYCVMYQLEF